MLCGKMRLSPSLALFAHRVFPLMPSHRIRLAGPWEFRTKAETNPAAVNPAGIRVQLPFEAAAELPGETGWLSRRFHCPGGLQDTTTIRLQILAGSVLSRVTINGLVPDSVEISVVETSAGTPSAGTAGDNVCRDLAVHHAMEIRPFLRPFNLLEIEVSGGSRTGDSTRVREVWLEIAEP